MSFKIIPQMKLSTKHGLGYDPVNPNPWWEKTRKKQVDDYERKKREMEENPPPEEPPSPVDEEQVFGYPTEKLVLNCCLQQNFILQVGGWTAAG